MMVFYGDIDKDTTIDVDLICSEICTIFPQAQIVSENAFDEQRKKTLETIQALRGKIRRPDIILQSITNREEFYGKAKIISIPIGDGVLKGEISERSIVLRGDCKIENKQLHDLELFVRKKGFSNLRIADVGNQKHSLLHRWSKLLWKGILGFLKIFTNG